MTKLEAKVASFSFNVCSLQSWFLSFTSIILLELAANVGDILLCYQDALAVLLLLIIFPFTVLLKHRFFSNLCVM